MSTTKTTTPTRFDELDVNLIRPNPRNPRTRLGDLTALADSIRAQGLIEPIVVEPDPEADDDGGWLLISGHRRLAAARKADLDVVPAIIRGSTSKPGPQVEAMLVENLQREDLTTVETADAYQALLDLDGGDYTPATIAKRVGVKKKLVTDHLKVVGLPESARQRIITGQLTLEDAARLEPFRKDARAVARLERAAESGPLAFHQAIHVEEEHRRSVNAAKKTLAAARKAGHLIIDDDDPDQNGVLEHAQEVDEIAYYFAVAKADGIDSDERDRLVKEFVDGHGSCPGHAVVQYSAGDDIGTMVVCLEPDHHHPELFPDSAGPAAEDPSAQERHRQEREAAEQRRREEDELRLQLRAAARTRRAFLGQVAAQPEAEQLAKTILLRGFDWVFPSPAGGHEALQVLAGMVLPDLPERTTDDPPALAGRIKKRLESMSVTELVLAAVVREKCRAEASLADGLHERVWGPSARSRAWLDDVVDLWKYELTDVEQQMLDVHDPAKGDES